MYCSNCGKEIDDHAVYCNYCGVPAQNRTKNVVSSDDTNTGCLIGGLCFFFPIVGLILYLVWKDTNPVSAVFAGKWALIGFILNTIIGFLVFSVGSIGGMM